jgi:hypothetical protein
MTTGEARQVAAAEVQVVAVIEEAQLAQRPVVVQLLIDPGAQPAPEHPGAAAIAAIARAGQRRDERGRADQCTFIGIVSILLAPRCQRGDCS